MIKLQSFLIRRADMTHEEFRDYWLNKHVPVAKELQGLQRYRTAVPVEPEQSQYDGIAELYFNTVDEFKAVLGPDSDTEAIQDVNNFEEDTDRHLVTETVHVDRLGDSRRSYKLVAVLTRDSGLTHDEFVERLSSQDPPVDPGKGLRKYTTAVPHDPAEANADGIVELYFDDLSSLTADLSPTGNVRNAEYPVDSSVVDEAISHVVEETVQLDVIDS